MQMVRDGDIHGIEGGICQKLCVRGGAKWDFVRGAKLRHDVPAPLRSAKPRRLNPPIPKMRENLLHNCTCTGNAYFHKNLLSECDFQGPAYRHSS